MVHRDLKPDNIGFADDGRLVLLDFGLAKLIPHPSIVDYTPVQMTGNTGSARYMAPEVCLSMPYNGKADVYSFAIVLYEVASLETPYDNFTMQQHFVHVVRGGHRPRLHKDWPEALQSLLRDCWLAEPERRPSFSKLRGRCSNCLVALNPPL